MIRLLPALAAATALLFGAAQATGQTDACATDVDGDGIVGGADLTVVLNDWGPCQRCVGDVNGDGTVDGIDLATVLTRWGSACAPTVISLTPDAGPLVGGVPVTITGNNILNPLEVTFGGTPATVVNSSRSTISVMAPAGAQGSAAVVVITRGGSTVAGAFAYLAAPTITAVSPNSGVAAGGQTITVTGSNFYGNPSVLFGASPASSVLVLSPTQLAVVVPPGVAGSTVSLTVSSSFGATTLPNAFAYLAIYVPPWATLLEAIPDPAVVTSESLRNAITATGYAWRVRDSGTGIEMVLVPPGTFSMGCTGSATYPCDSDEQPVHAVTLSSAFYLGRYEVTQAQWTARMGSNPSVFQGSSFPDAPNRPVEQVSWNSIQAFLTATNTRLPSEAEWEFACRGGTSTAFHGFPGIPEGIHVDNLVGYIAWYGSNSGGQTHAVGSKAGNGFGLHDMSGNVWEWVRDWYSESYYYTSASVNPTGPATGVTRVLRGGSYFPVANQLRSSYRFDATPSAASGALGFRVARNP
jgi:formylglycine-generating enzyme required for sulfatase activity